MAFDASAVGKVTVKVVVAVLSAPKSNTATAAPVVLLYIKAPRAVKLAGLHVTFANDTNAVVLLMLLVGTVGLRASPPGVYPVPVTSLSVVYTSVAAFKVALAVYRAIL
jgi:hypothetical protein